jgi:CBS domain-containing protein
MQKEDVKEFIRTVAPFDRLPEAELDRVVDGVAIEFYAKGTRILAQDGPASEYLRIIRRGGVRVFVLDEDKDEETVIDVRGEGEQFGMLSVMSGDRSRANVDAVEDTLCLLVGRERVMDVVRDNPALSDYFLKSFFVNFIDKQQDETRRRHIGLGESERLLYTIPVRDLLSRAPVTAPIDTSIQAAAALMAKQKVSSLVLVNAVGKPTGIITDRDLREKVVARGMDINLTAGSIMNSPLIKVDAGEYCFEALLSMMRHKIHHILVFDGEIFEGVITNSDFMLVQGSAPTALVKEVGEVRSLDQLAETAPNLRKTISTLLRDGAKGHNVAGLITELTEKVALRTVELIELEIGPPPLPATLFFHGDAARRELGLDMRMRLGVVYPDTHNMSAAREMERYHAGFAALFNSSMASCSGRGEAVCIPPVGHVRMLADWKVLVDSWPLDPDRFEGFGSLLEMRPIRGDEDILNELRTYVGAAATHEVLGLVAGRTLTGVRPPLGFMNRFVVEKSGEHKDELDLYAKGVRPMAAAVRLLAVRSGVRELSTVRRVQELGAKHGFALAEDVEHAFEYLLTLLIQNQLGQAERGQAPDGFINPAALGSFDRKALKETFRLTSELLDQMERLLKER